MKLLFDQNILICSFVALLFISCLENRHQPQASNEKNTIVQQFQLGTGNIARTLASEIDFMIESIGENVNAVKLTSVMNVTFDHSNDKKLIRLSVSYFYDPDSLDNFVVHKERLVAFYNTELSYVDLSLTATDIELIPNTFVKAENHLALPYQSQFKIFEVENSGNLLLVVSGDY
jgi:hypothetical protein